MATEPQPPPRKFTLAELEGEVERLNESVEELMMLIALMQGAPPEIAGMSAEEMAKLPPEQLVVRLAPKTVAIICELTARRAAAKAAAESAAPAAATEPKP